jgi:hypothetical protein
MHSIQRLVHRRREKFPKMYYISKGKHGAKFALTAINIFILTLLLL